MSLLNLPDDNLGLLSLGLRMMSTPGSFGSALGQAGMGALGDMQQHQANKQRRAMTELQTQQVRAQMEELARQQQSQTALRDYMGGLNPDGGMAPDMPGPRREPQSFDAFEAIRRGAEINPALQMQQMLTKATPQPVAVAKDTALWDPVTRQTVFSNVQPEKIDPNKPFMMKDGKVVPNPDYQAYAERVARAGASSNSLSVNTGQKGFDNTLKLRGDFRSEPVYKAHQEMQSAYSQIQQSLKQASPAGDLAGATKIMKLLDPGSVVRESELGMAMAASGLLDRAENYAQNILQGTKLTPTQRKDFQRLADALYHESVKQYNSKRGEYEGIATRNGLSVPDVLGPVSETPRPPANVDDLVNKYRSK